MPPQTLQLLAELRDAGLHIEPKDGGHVIVSPREKLTDELRARIRARKPEILAAIALERRIRAMASRWQYSPDELRDALAAAERSPAAWAASVRADEELHARLDRAGLYWPGRPPV